MSDDFDFGFTAVDDIPTTASEPSTTRQNYQMMH